ncbi:lipopolysaccharide biosynthesis protein [Amycolatopsis jejuensis]|uniref:lipopolysaccharide biosynthesis protein n=1 Tax=Amycolatopsis jejuensis TaxID=330084 RepID=UPI00052535AA|nr:lipopolysaccharide biosynthesis protein [Amycolatopsis jejuensis]
MTTHAERPAPSAPKSTAAAAANGTRWTVAAMIVRQFGRLGFAVVLARLLGPTDFGVAAAATVYISLTAVLLEAGLSSSIVQKPDLRPQDEGVTFWSLVAIGLAMAGVTVLFSDEIASFLDVPDLGPVLIALAASPVLKGVSNVAAAKLQRNLRFRAMAVTEIVGTLLGGILGVVAAELGMRYWALVVQQVGTDLIVLVFWFAAAGLPKIVVDKEAWKYLKVFGLPLVGAQLIGYSARNIDNVVVSRFLGQTALSYYTVPYRIMLIPVGLLGNVANRVAFPVFAKVQDDIPRVRSVFLRITRVIGLVVLPGMLGVAVLADDFVETIFGAEWLPAAPVVQALAVTGVLQSLTTPGGSVFMGLGRADVSFRWAWIPLTVMVPAFFIGLPWGVTGVATAYTIATIVITPFLVRAIGRLAGFRLRTWVMTILPAFISTMPAVAAAWVIHIVLHQQGMPSIVVLVAGLVVVLAGYLGFLRLFFPALFREGLSAARMLTTGKLLKNS